MKIGFLSLAASFCYSRLHAPMAQLDSALASEAEGYRFESCWGYYFTFSNAE